MGSKPRVERAVQYVRGNFFAGEDFTGLSDAQARAEAWCRKVAATPRPRHDRGPAGRGLRGAGSRGAAAAGGAAYDVPVFARVKVHRDFHVEVGRSLYSAPQQYLGPSPGRPRRLGAGQAFTAGSWSRPIPGPSRAGGSPTRLTCPRRRPPTRCGTCVAGQGRARARRAHRRLRRAAARHRPALDEDAAGLPAARAGPPLRARPGRYRLRPGAGPRRRQRHQDRLDAREGHREHAAPPPRPPVAGPPGSPATRPSTGPGAAS